MQPLYPRPTLLPFFAFCLVTTSFAGKAKKNQPCRSSQRGIAEVMDRPCQPRLFRQITGDFKNVFTRKENLWIVGSGLGAAWAVSPLDDNIANSSFNSEYRHHHSNGLDNFFEAGEIVGGGAVQFGGAFATFGLGKLLGKPEMEDVGRDLVRAQILTQSFTFVVKSASGRLRPDGSNDRSFPSGHSSSTFATATVLQRWYGWKVGVPAYALAGYIAGSRLNESRHYLSDVIFGASLGIMAGRTVTVGLGDRRFVVGPAVVPGGGGVQLTLLSSDP